MDDALALQLFAMMLTLVQQTVVIPNEAASTPPTLSLVMTTMLVPSTTLATKDIALESKTAVMTTTLARTTLVIA